MKLNIGNVSIDSQEDIDKKIKNIPDIEEDTKKEIGVNLKNIKEYEAKLKKRRKFEGDAGYYFSICFRTTEERNKFLEKHKIQLLYDNHVFYEEIKHIVKE